MPVKSEQTIAATLLKAPDFDENLSRAQPPRPTAEVYYEFKAKSTLGSGFSATRSRLTRVVSKEIVPKLTLLHSRSLRSHAATVNATTKDEIAQFAALVLSLDPKLAERHVSHLIDHDVLIERIFVDLFEPTARYLGRKWDNDECDFFEVTRGLAYLQTLLGKFGPKPAMSAPGNDRQILMSTLPGEEHSFGMNMVETLLAGSGWRVHPERAASTDRLVGLVKDCWFAAVGINVSSMARLKPLASTIHFIRKHSINSNIGILVGGSVFLEKPELVATVGADATAVNAPLALLAAQQLYQLGIQRRLARQ